MKKSYLLPLLLLLASGLFAQKKVFPTADKTAPPLDPTQFQGPPPDIEPPVIVCLNGLNANLSQIWQVTLFTSDVLESVSDNVTPNAAIKIGIRKSGAGTGFPVDGNGDPIENVYFDCNQLGPQSIELWAIDEAGNAAYCETTVLISDDFGYCNAGVDSLHLCIQYGCNGLPMPGVALNINGVISNLPPISFLSDSVTGIDGCANLFLPDLTGSYTITAVKEEDPLLGVSTYDLLLIAKHILGVEPLDNPYKLIAADANKSGAITSFDLVELRKLIMGLYSELPNNTSWRFVDGDFVFPNPVNPFGTGFPEYITVVNGQSSGNSLTGVKIGDVDCSASLDSLAPPDYPDALLAMPDTILQAGQVYDLPLYMLENGSWEGYQFRLNFDSQKMHYQSMVLHNLTGPSNWNTMAAAQGTLTTSWIGPNDPGAFGSGTPIATIRFSALETVALKNIVSISQTFRSESYTAWDAEKRDLVLTFVPQFKPGPGDPSAEKLQPGTDPKILYDPESPTLVCKNVAIIEVHPSTSINVWSFINYLDDNATPTDQLITAIRFAGTGSGFPMDAQGNPIVSIDLTCLDLGGHTLELWAKDASGNLSHCEISLAVVNSSGDCPPVVSSGLPIISVEARTGLNDGVEEMECMVTGSNPNEPFFVTSYCDWPDDCYLYGVPHGSNVTVKPIKDDNLLNGVTTYDLVLIDMHIRGVALLNSPYKIIAADADANGVVDSVDLEVFRNLILGIYTSFPNNSSWRFVPKDFVFPDPLNPFAVPFPESATVQNIQFNTTLAFEAIKVGDVNNSAVANLAGSDADERAETVQNPTISIGLPYPNPTLAGASISIDLPESQNLRLEVTDLTGKRVWINNLHLEKGNQTLEIPAAAMPLPGLYVWRVQAGNLSQSGKIVRL